MIDEVTQLHKGDRVQRPFKDRMDGDIHRIKGSLVNLMKRRHGDGWKEKLTELIETACKAQDVVL